MNHLVLLTISTVNCYGLKRLRIEWINCDFDVFLKLHEPIGTKKEDIFYRHILFSFKNTKPPLGT